MIEINTQKFKLVGTGYAELLQDGRRYRFLINRWSSDAGEEWGEIVSREEIPDVGPYLWIPSHNIEAAEAQHLYEEHEYEKAHPNPLDQEQWAEHRAEQKKRMERYDQARDLRAALIKRSHRTAGR